MKFVKHSQCNTELCSLDIDIPPLPVTRGKLGESEVVRSYWRPTQRELFDLNHFGVVAVTLIGQTHAPIRLDVVPLVSPVSGR